MKLYKDIEHPLRVYLQEESPGEISRLTVSLDNRYAPSTEHTYSSTREEDEVTSLIFYDESLQRHYVVHGLLNIILKEAMSLGIVCNNEVDLEEINLEYPDIKEDILDGISLRKYQSEGISTALAHKRGIIRVHTGGGKTEMMIGVCRYLLDTTDMNILVCVPTTNLLYQTQSRMFKRGLSESDISLLGDGNKIDPTKRVLVATVASAYKRLDTDKEYVRWLSNLDCLILDEAHHSKCRTWSTLIDRVAPEYLLGFSAEPFHRDKDHIVTDLILRGLLGPVIHSITCDYLVSRGYLSKPYVLAIDSHCTGNRYGVVDWTTVNKYCIVRNNLRNDLIRDLASFLVNDKKNPLILVQQISHGQELAKSISRLGYNVTMLTGGLKVSVYLSGEVIDNYKDEDNRVIRDFDEGKIDVLIGTSTLDEGVDIPSLSSVILAGGGKGRLKTVQKVGRSMRAKGGLNLTFIIDFRDRFNVITQSQFKKRKALYDELNMPVYFVEDSSKVEGTIRSIEYERSVELERNKVKD